MLFQDLSCMVNTTFEAGVEAGFYEMLEIEWLSIVTITRNGRIQIDGTLDISGMGNQAGTQFIYDNASILMEADEYATFEKQGYNFSKLFIRDTSRYEVMYIFCRRNKPFTLHEMKWASLYTQKSYGLVLANNELAQNNNYIATVFDSVESLIFVLDPNFQIITYNQSCQDSFLSKENNKLTIDMLGLDDREMFIEHLYDVLDKGSKINFDTTYKNKNNEKRISSFYLSPFKNGKGEIVGIVVVGSDITKIRMASHEIDQLSNYALMGEMAIGLSHDVKNPLSNINGCVHLLKKNNHYTIDKKNELLLIVEQEIERINQIVEEILSYNKLTKDNEGFVDINQVLLDCKHIIERQKVFKKINIITELDSRMPYVNGKNSDFQQIFLNIMLNAMQSIDIDGQILIKSQYDKITDELKVEIIDSGKGMTSEELNEIGTPFYTTKKSGTGLGLYIVQRFIEKYSGELLVKSEKSVGTECSVTFKTNEVLI